MGAYVFNNEIFDSWLNKKTDEILGKVNRETISTEEMIVLILKAQTNHFSHMDQDLKNGLLESRNENREDRNLTKKEFQLVRDEMTKDRESTKKEFQLVRDEIAKDRESTKKEFQLVRDEIKDEIDFRFTLVDKRFDRMSQYFLWMAGLIITSSLGIYLKLFLNP